IWSNCYGSAGTELSSGICRSSRNMFWVTGSAILTGTDLGTNYGKEDVWTIQIDTLGNLLSSKNIGSPDVDHGRLVHPLAGGAVLVAGHYSGSGMLGGEFPTVNRGGLDVFIARFAPWTTNVKETSSNHFPMRVFPNPANKELYIE